MSRPDTVLLHGPWPDTAPDPDARALTALAREYAGRWIIWRAMSPQRHKGAWCARRADSDRAPAGLSATSPEQLRRQLEEADR